MKCLSISTFVAGFLLSSFCCSAEEATATAQRGLRILPLGDSLTRGSYLARYLEGPYNGEPIGLPNPAGGGYRKPLQDQLRQAGIAFEFVGELTYDAYGNDGRADPAFDPHHQGMAGFSNRKIIDGGVVPTPKDVLDAKGVTQVSAHGVVEVLIRFNPDIVLLISGGNGFDAPSRDELITLIGQHSSAHLIVGTITPQKPPRAGYEQVRDYNSTLLAVVSARHRAGQKISMVDLHPLVREDELLIDGVHPDAAGMQKIADSFFAAISRVVPDLRPARTPSPSPPLPFTK